MTDNAKLLAIAHAALSMVDTAGWSDMFVNWHEQAIGTVEATLKLALPVEEGAASKPKRKKRKKK